MITVTDINPQDIDKVWPLVRGTLEPVVEKTPDYTMPDIHVGLLTGLMKLWISYEETGKVRGVSVVELRHYHERTVCFILFAAGGDLSDWDLGSSCIEQWAMEVGAEAIQAHARKGVVRRFAAAGYRPISTVVEKELTQRRLH